MLFYNRACCYALSGENKKAIKDLQSAIKLYRDLYKYMLIDEELNELRQSPNFYDYFNFN